MYITIFFPFDFYYVIPDEYIWDYTVELFVVNLLEPEHDISLYNTGCFNAPSFHVFVHLQISSSAAELLVSQSRCPMQS